jgi:class 3 adenylate cyclase/tetratricopeptide (TPR) repeat protein
VIHCPSCGFEAPDEFTFCPQCATKLSRPSSAVEERKTVTTLFCDLVGFTAMSEAADPEDITVLLGEYARLATIVIQQHGGTVEKFIGDAVVGVFGVPAVREDDAARAVVAGLELVEVVAGLCRPDGSPLAARVGINTGEAVVRLDIDPASGHNFLTGDAVNTAARLEAAAPPDGVVVGALTHALTVGDVAYGELPPLSLKGKSGRVEAWLAEATLGTRPRQIGSEIVGRAAELSACETAVSRLEGGIGGLLLITGEAGVGKTRLLQELLSAARARQIACLEGRTLSFGRSISYWPFMEILAQDAGFDSDDDEAERWDKLESRVAALFGDETPEILPYLGSLVGLTVPTDYSEKVRYLDGESMGRQIYRVTRLYFAQIARERPLVLAFEDLHWMDASSAALLEHLLPLIDEQALLVCCLARPEMDTPLARIAELAETDYSRHSVELPLGHLSQNESTTLAANLLRVQRLPEALRNVILSKAEGNPFFVEEVVRCLIDQGGLERQSDGSYRVTEKAGAIAVPDSLLGVIMARIDRLDGDLKQVLRLAAVIGRTFFYRLLAAIGEADRQLDESLVGLQTRELVLEHAREPELEYAFKHALVQEATYESILKARRRELHAEVAAAIETLFADRVEDFYSLLAYHYTKAEDWQKAQDFLFKAGDQAGSIAADAEALDHYEAALRVYQGTFQEQLDPFDYAVVERKMGEALFRRGEHERAREHFARALEALGRPFPSSDSAVRHAIIWQVLVQLRHRLSPHGGRARHPGETPEMAEELFLTYYSRFWMDTAGDQSQLLLATLLGLNLAEHAGLDWATPIAMGGASYICDLIPLHRLWQRYHRLAVAITERSPEPSGLAVGNTEQINGCHLCWAKGEWADAVEWLDRGRAAYRAVGRVRDWGAATVVGVDALYQSGDLRGALGRATEVVSFGQETGDRVVEGWGRFRAGYVLTALGRLDEGELELRTAHSMLESAIQPAAAVTAAGWLAVSYLRQGRAGEAAELLPACRETVRVHGVRGYFLPSYRLAEVMLPLAVAEGCEGTARAEALATAKTELKSLYKLAKADISALVPAHRLHGTYDWLAGRQKKAGARWERSREVADRLGSPFERALTDLEDGRLRGDRDALTNAAGVFERVGAEAELRRAQSLI